MIPCNLWVSVYIYPGTFASVPHTQSGTLSEQYPLHYDDLYSPPIATEMYDMEINIIVRIKNSRSNHSLALHAFLIAWYSGSYATLSRTSLKIAALFAFVFVRQSLFWGLTLRVP